VGWDRDWVMAFTFVSLLFLRSGVRQAIPKFFFFVRTFLASCEQFEFENTYILTSSSYLRVHSLSGGSPTALKYPSKQGHTDNPRRVPLLLAGQGRQVTFMDRYIPDSQPLVGKGFGGEQGNKR